MMKSMKMLQTCSPVSKRQAINVRNCCMQLVDSFKCMIMHGLENPKFIALSIGFLLPTSTKSDLNTLPPPRGFFPPVQRYGALFQRLK
jgi:hypothetical protein